ncbi:MAG: hypothetical protein OEZ39_08835 [Gammaproteobacteria bacterium]|nr:hypothetical protein [Gammaproteobacteria bacterium]MDH5651969.1 hypothetical protein [Gammaproteobacteria bacterium]
MSMYLTFFTEIALCFTISLITILLLQKPLRDVLIDSCGAAQRADFWLVFTRLMLVVTPLMLVIFFTKTGTDIAPNSLLLLKETLFRSLLGIFGGLLIMGRVIWRSVELPVITNNHLPHVQNGTKA